MPNLDVRITSMYPPGSQGGTRAIASATIAGCFAVRGIKILIAVVLGALLLAGLYALFNDTVLPTLVRRVQEMFDYSG